MSGTYLSCETAGCAHKGKREKNEDKRRQAGKRYSRIGKLRRLRGQPQEGWKSSLGSGGQVDVRARYNC